MKIEDLILSNPEDDEEEEEEEGEPNTPEQDLQEALDQLVACHEIMERLLKQYYRKRTLTPALVKEYENQCVETSAYLNLWEGLTAESEGGDF